MRIYLHIGMEYCGADRIQEVLDAKRDQLSGKGVLVPNSAGKKNHTRLYMAVTDPDHVDPLRQARGFADPADQERLRDKLAQDLTREIAKHAPKSMILTASQLGMSLSNKSELERLRAFLLPFSDDIRIVAHLDEQARVLTRHYAEAIWSGRKASLEQELALVSKKEWRRAALRTFTDVVPAKGAYNEVQAAPFWLDYKGLEKAWADVFGAKAIRFRSFDPKVFYGPGLTGEMIECFDLPKNIGKSARSDMPRLPSAASLARGREMNDVLLRLMDKGLEVPRKQWREFMREIAVPGEAIAPGSLAAISKVFEAQNKALAKDHKGLSAAALTPDAKQDMWCEADPTRGFRATQYVAAFLPRIRRGAIAEAEATHEKPSGGLSPSAEKLMTPLAKENYAKLAGGSFAPHNKLGAVNEEELAAAFETHPKRKLKKGSSGNVIVACMKNEGPYILEWIAYHRAIGVDNFIIYTNGCEDGTAEILDRLQELGIAQHRNNDDWKGNSPQQYALNQSLKEDVIKNAEWIAHIDVDEFMNIRCGNGTLDDFFARVPDATNVAMTWRLFGHNGVTKFEDKLVIEQFDACAPKFCPKPHTVWGFKTMFKNIGAYEKISCHRPNKLDDAFRNKVKWVNGSGKIMPEAVKDNGWRSSKNSVGYDLIQLNHYALRSAESFLIKRQRGRALHVDRSIGINYWVRMDWCDYRDITIKRNIPRVREEFDALKQDKDLVKHHEFAVAWHHAKAADLHSQDEFEDLYTQALSTHLDEMERVAYALALDMES